MENVDKNTDNNAVNSKNKKHSPMNNVQVFLLNLLIVIISLWLLFGFVLSFTVAPNDDMSPNIRNHDLLLSFRLEKELHAQDVVVIKKNNITYVGRVVAVSGDEVDISDENHLIINGSSMIETNIYSETPRYEGFVEYPVKIGSGEYFILADSRNGGEDSRYYGTVKDNEIVGKVVTVIRRTGI